MLLITLIYILNLFTLINCSYYCKIEKKLCENKKHIGCSIQLENEIHELDNNNIYENIEIKNEFILSLLDVFNTGRNQIALFEQIGNMKFLNWHNEFQFLTESKVDSDMPMDKICVATEEYNDAKLIYLDRIIDSNDSTTILSDVMWVLRKKTKRLKDNQTMPFLNEIFYEPGIDKIGCGISKYTMNENPAYQFRCIYNLAYNITPPTTTNNEQGPCKACSDWNLKCNNLYTGLCGNIKFPINSMNTKFLLLDENKNESDSYGNYGNTSLIDAILWCLGIILFLGLLISCIIKIRKIALRSESDQGVVVKLYSNVT